jgi:CubicO group peptidase (beta-lactamase class C family)
MTDALVIGGTRFIGRHAVSEFLDHGYDVAIFNRGEHENPFGDTVDHVEGDRTNDSALEAAAARVDRYLSRLEPFGWHGAVLVSRGGEVLLAEGYGTADHAEEGEASRPWTAGTVSTVGSITKQFTAAAIVKLAEDGALSLDDSLPVFFDGVPPDKRGITLHHLLTHTSGLRGVGQGDFDRVSRAEIVRLAMEAELATEPGSEYAYSNLGYSLLGAMVEEVTGTPYEAWIREHLFRPAGMYETGYLLPRYEPARLATGYREGERWGTVIERIPEATGPSWVLMANGGMHSTLYDMHRWVRSLMTTERILTAGSRETLLTPYADEGGGSWYAYGWVVDTTSRSTPIIQHNGGNGILHADIHWFPEDGETLTFAMSNHAEVTAIDVLDDVDAVYFGQDVRMPPEVSAADVSPEPLAGLAGRYRLPDGGELEVVALGSRLEIRVSGQELLDRLSTAPRDDGLDYAALNRRAGELVRALMGEDYATVREALGPEAPERPFAGARERILRFMGPFRSVEVMGTLPVWYEGSPSEAVTWLRLAFEQGTTVRRVHWTVDGGMAGLGGQAVAAPLTLACAMTSSEGCIGWDPNQPAANPRFRFRRGDDGHGASVTVEAEGWSSTAERMAGG